jgi:hypothetical protein
LKNFSIFRIEEPTINVTTQGLVLNRRGNKMAKCGYCGTTIIFGGVKENGLRFCNSECHQKGHVLILAGRIPKDLVEDQAGKIHRGLCPRCQGNGPVDVHTSYRVYSVLVYTSRRSIQNVCCRSCGIKSQIRETLFSLVVGWWGFPWGLIMTPVQISRNIAGMLRGPDDVKPSDKLEDVVRIGIAAQSTEDRKIV